MEVEGETFKKGNCSCGYGVRRDWLVKRGREAACARLVHRQRTVQARSSRDTNKQIFLNKSNFPILLIVTPFLQFVFAQVRFVLFTVVGSATIRCRLILCDINKQTLLGIVLGPHANLVKTNDCYEKQTWRRVATTGSRDACKMNVNYCSYVYNHALLSTIGFTVCSNISCCER